MTAPSRVVVWVCVAAVIITFAALALALSAAQYGAAGFTVFLLFLLLVCGPLTVESVNDPGPQEEKD
jgi:hypothetical protein